MELNKQWLSRVASIGKSQTEDELRLREVAGYAVKAAYSNGDFRYVEHMLNGDTLPQFARQACARWFRRMGLNIESPIPGTVQYLVGGVLDQKKQSKVFEDIKSTEILDVIVKARAEKRKKVLEGTAADRAAGYVTKLLRRLKTDDTPDLDAAALINDRFAGAFETPTNVIFGKDGTRVELSDDDMELVFQFLAKRAGVVGTLHDMPHLARHIAAA
jgi:hypothetical protein